jgi:hypothetical protein
VITRRRSIASDIEVIFHHGTSKIEPRGGFQYVVDAGQTFLISANLCFSELEQVFQINAAINNKAAPVAANVQIVHGRNTSKVSLACNGSAFSGDRPGAYVNAREGDGSM